MIEISSLTVLIFAELIVGLVALSGVLLLFTLLRKARIRKAAAHLVERVQSDKANREQRLKVLLQEGYQLTGSDLEQALHNIMQTEMLLYQNVINGFLKDDQVHLQQLDVDVENLVLGYQGLELPDSANKAQQASTDDEEDIARLKEENERLSEELRVTMDTMGRMLNEYSTMFSGGAPAAKSVATQGAEAADEAQQVEEDREEQPLESEQQESPEQSDATAGSSMASDLAIDTEIPDLSTEELAHSSHLTQSADLDAQDRDAPQPGSAENASLDEDAAETQEEVSEIIDEVMEIADEMLEESEIPTQMETEDRDGESMVDDLEKIDIEIPEEGEPLADSTEFEAGSLEEEWAKLLEEDAASGKKQDQDP